MAERTQCTRCRKLDEVDEPFDTYPLPTILRRKGDTALLVLPADDANEPDHLCPKCRDAYGPLMAEFMGEDFVLTLPVDEDGMDLAEDEGGDDADEETGT